MTCWPALATNHLELNLARRGPLLQLPPNVPTPAQESAAAATDTM